MSYTQKPIEIVYGENGEDGVHAAIFIDDCPGSPRDWGIATIAGWTRRYKLGDEQPKVTPQGFLECLADLYDVDLPQSQMLEKVRKKYFIEPLYMYEHGLVSLSMRPYRDPFDSGQVGYIYISREDVAKEAPKHLSGAALEDWVKSVFKSEIDTYVDYLNGNVYLVQCGDDCIGGIYGEDYAREVAQDLIREYEKSQEDSLV